MAEENSLEPWDNQPKSIGSSHNDGEVCLVNQMPWWAIWDQATPKGNKALKMNSQ